MKISHLAIPVLASSQGDETTMLSMKFKVQSTLEAGLDQLLDVVGSRNVSEMSALLQNLVEETINEGVEGPYGLPAETYTALDVIKTVLLGDIRIALKEAHCLDQRELHERILCFEKCELAKESGAISCGDKCTGEQHTMCRNDLLTKYKTHVQECWALDAFVNKFNYEKCPEYKKETCLLSDSTWNCVKCSSEMSGLVVAGKEPAPTDWSDGQALSTNAWFTKTIRIFEEAYTQWGTLHKACTDSYKEYIKKDAECDCEQAECETINCAWENCRYNNCEDVYNKCWARCEGEYKRTNEAKECLEKDRKIDWSATEKIECYVNVLLEEPDNATLLEACGTTDCYNEYREQLYKKCNSICVEVDFDNDSGEFKHHKRRIAKDAHHHGKHGNVTKHNGRHRDIDVTAEGFHSVRTKHRHHADNETAENRCTSHLDLDYQEPPCCTPCEIRPSEVCSAKKLADGTFETYSKGCDPEEDDSYMCVHYGQHDFLATHRVHGLDKPYLAGENAPQVMDDCHKQGKEEGHAYVYAYNLCACLECTPPSKADVESCTEEKYCKESYDYRKHDVVAECETTTTTTPTIIPPVNCPWSAHKYGTTCHLWGDPHFTHIFETNKEYLSKGRVKKGGRHGYDGHKMFDFNPSGVFHLASSADGFFDAQAFFCPFAAETTTGVGLAVRFGSDVIHIVRGNITKSTSGTQGEQMYYADLSSDKEKEFTEFYVNGKRVTWAELGSTVGTRGSDVRKDWKSKKGEGFATGTMYMQQMRTTNGATFQHWEEEANTENDLAILPVCLVDATDSDRKPKNPNTIVEVSTPYIEKSLSLFNVYEHSITVRMKNPVMAKDGVAPSQYGICGGEEKKLAPQFDMEEEDEDHPSDEKKAWIAEQEKFRVNPKSNMFTSFQMHNLCDMCRLPMDGEACGAPGHDVSPESVCDHTGMDIEKSRNDCKSVFDETDKPGWFRVCVLEVCASGDSALGIAKIEEQISRLHQGMQNDADDETPTPSDGL